MEAGAAVISLDVQRSGNPLLAVESGTG